MGFWLFMIMIDLITPFTMVVFGKMFMRKAPKDINYVFDYRTKRSMKSRETWAFAANDSDGRCDYPNGACVGK